MRIVVDIPGQYLDLVGADGSRIRRYPVSTALNGPGERNGSGCTPSGRHVIRARIGAGQPACTVFKGRRPTGEQWSEALARAQPARDWILSRILWLSGLEPGRNRLGDCDSMRRYIYIHGTPDTEPMGVPRSHGCIRMRIADVVELFDLVDAGTPVDIRA
ncbi:L,D-transpeptidase [Nitrogeniibacter mangrovi]|uniref:L,D-transpeptidase n=1 Tax=Nitrogeniibacter mangrovi TaxID=2016596 RepID=A0A6C1BAS1_9RHOO|nr:L,D-transpeptidase [Nitrogeniibacter mangrovi]QID19798.1 L,D-transpeptidase [Nitrogeniibacter mangrovi]